MFFSLKNLKSLALALSIAAGTLLQGHGAHADTAKALLAGGCFWCVEADFEQLPGVIDAVSGFAGGDVANPTYRQVGRGGTGHLEAVELTYDPKIIGYDEILDLFLRSIDPFDDGGQFCDRGESYTAAIFALDPSQDSAALAAVARAEEELGRRIRTPIREAATFYPADEYHQDFYKSSSVILTRFGPQSKATAYKKYRKACNRDQRVKRVWGETASFVGS